MEIIAHRQEEHPNKLNLHITMICILCFYKTAKAGEIGQGGQMIYLYLLSGHLFLISFIQVKPHEILGNTHHRNIPSITAIKL